MEGETDGEKLIIVRVVDISETVASLHLGSKSFQAKVFGKGVGR